MKETEEKDIPRWVMERQQGVIHIWYKVDDDLVEVLTEVLASEMKVRNK